MRCVVGVLRCSVGNLLYRSGVVLMRKKSEWGFPLV